MLQSYIHQEVIAIRITESGYKTHYRQEVDWRYSVSAQILYIHESVMLFLEQQKVAMKVIIDRK